MVLSEETLCCVRLNRRHDFPWWSDPILWYYNIYKRCLEAKNPYALYVHSLHLGFKSGEIFAARYILNDIKDVYPYAKLMFIMLSFCTGVDCNEVYQQFCAAYKYKDVERMGSELIYHIKVVGPRCCDTYAKSWFAEDFPECWEEHEMLGEVEDEHCKYCVYYYLSLTICKLT